MKKIFFCYLILFSSTLYSQVGGESIFQFLNLTSSSRQVALGGEVLTLINDVNQPIWNPSTINAELDKQLSINYTNFLAGISVGSASYSQVINRRFGAIHGSIKYLNYGTLIEADENGNETGNFKASDVALSVGYAFNLPWTNIFMGFNGKLVNSTISNFTSNGIAADIAVLYYSPYKSYAFTLVARNIGTQIQTFDGTNVAVPNPSNASSDLEGNITNENISFFTNAIRHLVIGAELFPDSPINLRAGYNFRRSSELKLQNARTFSGISFGFGIKMNKLRFNYAFSKYHAATNASTFSLQFDLDKR